MFGNRISISVEGTDVGLLNTDVDQRLLQ